MSQPCPPPQLPPVACRTGRAASREGLQREPFVPDRPLALPQPDRLLEHSVGLQLRRLVTQLGLAIERRMEPLGLTDAQWKPLVRLLLQGPSSASALARDCHIDSGGLTRLLDRLQAKGLVQRQRPEHDRRVVHVSLTPPGRQVAEQLPAVLAQVQEQLLHGFDPDARQQLWHSLQRLQHNLDAMAQPPCDEKPAFPTPDAGE